MKQIPPKQTINNSSVGPRATRRLRRLHESGGSRRDGLLEALDAQQDVIETTRRYDEEVDTYLAHEGKRRPACHQNAEPVKKSPKKRLKWQGWRQKALIFP